MSSIRDALSAILNLTILTRAHLYLWHIA